MVDSVYNTLFALTLNIIIALVIYFIYTSLHRSEGKKLENKDKFLAILSLFAVFLNVLTLIKLKGVGPGDIFGSMILLASVIRVFVYNERLSKGLFTFLIWFFVIQFITGFFISYFIL